MPKPKQKRARTGNREQSKMARRLDDLAEFEEFKKTILGVIKKDLNLGLSAPEIYKKYTAFLAARDISLALTTADPNVAKGFIKQSLDRSMGKATERKEIKHEYADLSDKELDALLNTRSDEEKKTKVKH